MYDITCIWILLIAIFIYSGARASSIQINQHGNGILGGNETSIVCSFNIEPQEVLLFTLRVSARNLTTQIYYEIATFILNKPANLEPGGMYLQGRVHLNSSLTSSSSGQASISFKNLTCDDEKEYKVNLTIITSDGHTFLFYSATNISVQASPMKPEIYLLLDSTQFLAEKANATFQCVCNLGRPAGQYIWQKILKNNSTISPGPYDSIITTESLNSCTYNGSSLLIIELSAEDNQAVIRCLIQSVTTMTPLYQDTKPLNVLYKVRTPIITKHPNQDHHLVGSGDIELTCHAEGNPQSSYKWFKGDNMNQTLSSNATFVIDSNNTINNGTYLCQAFNSLNGRIHNQTQSVDIFLVYILPNSTPTSTFPTGILKAVNKAFCEEDYCKILFGVGAGICIGLVLAIIFGIVRFHRKNSEKLIDTDDATVRNNSPRSTNGSASMNKGYEETENLPMSSMKKTDRKGTSNKDNKTLNYVEVDFVGDETSEITMDKKPVQEHPAKKNETVYSVVQKTKSVGNRKERMFTEESHGLQRDEDDPYADNNEVYDHLGNSRHKPNTAGEIFDHQQSSPEAKNSMKF